MGRFETPLQVAGLFFIAAFVSVGLIFFINAEAQSRLSDDNHLPPPNNPSTVHIEATRTEERNNGTFLNYLQSGMERLVRAVQGTRWVTWNEDEKSVENEKTSEGGHRRVRSADGKLSSSGYYWHNGLLDEDRASFVPAAAADYDTDSTKGHNGDSYPPPKSSSQNFHRIRHAVKKLGGGGLDLSVVERMILDSNPEEPEANSHREHPKITDENYKHNIHRRRFDKISREEESQRKSGSFSHNNKLSLVKATVLPFLPVASSSFVSEGLRYQGEWSQSQSGPNEKMHYNRNHHYNFNEPERYDTTKSNDKRLSSTTRTVTYRKNAAVPTSLTTDNISEGDSPDRDIDLYPEPVGQPKDTHKKSMHMENLDRICYRTDNGILIVVAITCCLNFAFVLVVWGCVRWCSVANNIKEKEFQQFDCEDVGDSILFRAEHEDQCWSSGNSTARDREFLKHRIKRFGRTVNSTSLYTFRPDYVPQHCIQRCYSHSMEDLRYIHT